MKRVLSLATTSLFLTGLATVPMSVRAEQTVIDGKTVVEGKTSTTTHRDVTAAPKMTPNAVAPAPVVDGKTVTTTHSDVTAAPGGTSALPMQNSRVQSSTTQNSTVQHSTVQNPAGSVHTSTTTVKDDKKVTATPGSGMPAPIVATPKAPAKGAS